jgi:hypothetical protein
VVGLVSYRSWFCSRGSWFCSRGVGFVGLGLCFVDRHPQGKCLEPMQTNGSAKLHLVP